MHYATQVLANQSNNSRPLFLAVGFNKPHIPFKYPAHFRNLFPLESIELPSQRMYPLSSADVAYSTWSDLRSRHDVAHLNLTFPFQAIPDDFQKRIVQSYLASTTYVDVLIGKLLDQLEVSRLTNNTIVALISDHGWSLGESAQWAKYSLFDQALRVPFVISVPDRLLRNSSEPESSESIRIAQTVELLDLFPTLVELAGLKSLAECGETGRQAQLCVQGRSLKPLLIDAMRNGGNAKRSGRPAFSQYPRPSIHPQTNSDQPRFGDINIMGYSMRTAEGVRYSEWLQFNRSSLRSNWSHPLARELYLNDDAIANFVFEPSYEGLCNRLSTELREQFDNTLS